MTKAGVGAAVLAISMAFAPLARGEELDRADTIAAIDAKVQAIGIAVEGFVSSRDPSHVSDAVTAAIELRGLVTALARVKGDDGRAGEIAAHYPHYIDAFLRVAPELVVLAGDQHRADGIAEHCAKDEAALQLAIEQAKVTDDLERTIAKLSARGDEEGRRWGAALRELGDVDKAVTAAAAAARLSLTDSYWMNVSAKVNEASTALAAAWTDDYRAVTSACEPLARGSKHPDLAQIVIELGQRANVEQAAASRLVHDYNAWLHRIRELRELAERHREAVRAAICTATDDDRDDRAGNVADEWARELGAGYDAALAGAEQLRTSATATKKSRTPPIVAAGLKANLAIAAKLKAHELAGRRNPSLRATLAAIRQRREDLLKGCAYKRVDLEAPDCTATAGCHLQCVKVERNTCDVVEIAGNTDKAKNAGFAHGDVYAQALHAWYVRDKKELLAKYPALRGCENSNHTDLNLSNEVVTFDACGKLAPDQLGEVLPAVTSDLDPGD